MLVAPWSGEYGVSTEQGFLMPSRRATNVGKEISYRKLCEELFEENRKLRAVCRAFWKLANNAAQKCSDEVGETITNECIFRLQRLAAYYESRGQRL